VEPGDQLLLEARITRSRRQVWQFATQASVAGAVVAEADLMCAARKIADD
jgi:3-hydroxyacyl-[acyl-carrier-protein] dehydratase